MVLTTLSITFATTYYLPPLLTYIALLPQGNDFVKTVTSIWTVMLIIIGLIWAMKRSYESVETIVLKMDKEYREKNVK